MLNGSICLVFSGRYLTAVTILFQVSTPVISRYNLRSRCHTPAAEPLDFTDSVSVSAEMGAEVKHLANIAARNTIKALRTVEYSRPDVSSSED
jgi:hypothetical protein